MLTIKSNSHIFSVAPMMDWTDRHCRAFHRALSRRALLYSEMETTGALLHGPRERLLAHDECEHPVALQIGGNDPVDLATCARLGEIAGFDEINLNCGCPSDRVQNGRFGACLMAAPALVRDCVAAMRDAVSVPVTVKSRIGIDDHEGYAPLRDFVGAVSESGCERFIVHARKAWLQGLSPRQNREIPPLRYHLVYRLKQEFPNLTFVVNGGIASLGAAEPHLGPVDGVMIGRAAYQDPNLLAAVDQRLFGDPGPAPDRFAVLARHRPYMEAQLAAGQPLFAMARHMLGLFNGQRGARAWRRILSEGARDRAVGIEVLDKALAAVAATPAQAA